MANEVAVSTGNFNLITLEGEIAEAIAEEMDGLGTIPYDRVKIPSGGGLAFELPGEDDEDTQSATELVGVILFHHPINAYWKEKFAGGNEKPDCSSYDGKTGVIRETGECRDCAACPYNQFGSDGNGKACKNVHRVYMLREGNPVPIILSLPPTSLKYMRDYISKRILLKGMRSYHAVTKITLKKEKSAAGITYSRAAFTFVEKLAADQIASVAAMAEAIKQTGRNIDVDEDYAEPAGPAPRPSSVGDGFMEVPDSVNDEGLPFN